MISSGIIVFVIGLLDMVGVWILIFDRDSQFGYAKFIYSIEAKIDTANFINGVELFLILALYLVGGLLYIPVLVFYCIRWCFSRK